MLASLLHKLHVHHLILHRNHLHGNDRCVLFQNKSILHLPSHNRIRLEFLTRALLKNDCLKSLRITRNDLRSSSSGPLSKYIASSTTLQAIDLSGNLLGKLFGEAALDCVTRTLIKEVWAYRSFRRGSKVTGASWR